MIHITRTLPTSYPNFTITVLWLALLSTLPTSYATGNETPKMTLQDYFLPGMTKWDAIPFHNFRRVWWIALCVALGNVSQEGWSLLQTARNQDLGSAGNPGTAGQRIQSDNRNQRLFGAILNYIEATSWVYRYASTYFQNDGRGLFRYLYEYGHLPYTEDERTRLQNEWTDATMYTTGVKYNANAVFKWAEYVEDLAGRLGKTEREKRTKYLAGFPHAFDVMIVAERARGPQGSYRHPAMYPVHHPLHTIGGTPHPHAGEPDLIATAHGFYSEWERMISAGMIRTVPKGMAHRAVDEDGYASMGERLFGSDRAPPDQSALAAQPLNHLSNERAIVMDSNEERARMTKSAVTNRTVCGLCGGIGHAGKVDGVGVCLTALLGHKIPHDDLDKVTYPNGYNPPRFMHKPRASNSGPSRSTHFSQKASRPRARIVFEPDSSSEDEAYQLTLRRGKNSYKGKARISNPRPRSSTRPSARQVDEPPPKEHSQNSDHDADDHSEDEHGRLAVAFDDIVFP